MIVRKRKYKHNRKPLDKEQEKEIIKIRRNNYQVEKVELDGKVHKIPRPMFYAEAKEIFFEENG